MCYLSSTGQLFSNLTAPEKLFEVTPGRQRMSYDLSCVSWENNCNSFSQINSDYLLDSLLEESQTWYLPRRQGYKKTPTLHTYMSQLSHVFYNVMLSSGSTEWSPEPPELSQGDTLCISQHISTPL